MQEAVNAMLKLKFKSGNKNDKNNTQEQNKLVEVNKINQMRQVLHKHRTMKKCYCCDSGTHMLNNVLIRDTIEICQ